MIVYEGTTPTITLQGPETVDFTTLGTCRVDITQRKNTISFTNPTVTAHSVSVTLTQQQTLSLKPMLECEIQANFKSGSTRVCTVPASFEVGNNLYDEVM